MNRARMNPCRSDWTPAVERRRRGAGPTTLLAKRVYPTVHEKIVKILRICAGRLRECGSFREFIAFDRSAERCRSGETGEKYA